MEKLIPLSKQSKKERRKFYSSKRGSWNGISPVTRVVRSRKVYDRKRMKSADRRACADWTPKKRVTSHKSTTDRTYRCSRF